VAAPIVAPLDLHVRRTDDQDGSDPVPQDHLLGDEAGRDGLAQADVVGDEQVDARHLDRTHDRLQVVVLAADAAAEGRLHIVAGIVRGCVIGTDMGEKVIHLLARAAP
jgi:hypothetical protein